MMPPVGSLVGLAILAVAILLLLRRSRKLERRLKDLAWELDVVDTMHRKLGPTRDGGRLLSWAATLAGAIGLTWLWRRRGALALTAASGTAGFLLATMTQPPSPPDEAEPVPTTTVTVTVSATATVTTTETVVPRPVSVTRIPGGRESVVVAASPRGSARPPVRPLPTPGQPTTSPPPGGEPPPGGMISPPPRCLLAADAEVDDLTEAELRLRCPG